MLLHVVGTGRAIDSNGKLWLRAADRVWSVSEPEMDEVAAERWPAAPEVPELERDGTFPLERAVELAVAIDPSMRNFG
jgi:hypothetical protein